MGGNPSQHEYQGAPFDGYLRRSGLVADGVIRGGGVAGRERGGGDHRQDRERQQRKALACEAAAPDHGAPREMRGHARDQCRGAQQVKEPDRGEHSGLWGLGGHWCEAEERQGDGKRNSAMNVPREHAAEEGEQPEQGEGQEPGCPREAARIPTAVLPEQERKVREGEQNGQVSRDTVHPTSPEGVRPRERQLPHRDVGLVVRRDVEACKQEPGGHGE